jgi:glycosyltransferase involved in cell wall biosynthesis
MPYGAGEEFLITESKTMLQMGHDILIVPRSPSNDVVNNDAGDLLPATLRTPLISREVLTAAIFEMCEKPSKCMRAIQLLFAGATFKTLIKNVAVIPKSLWLARAVGMKGFTHIHAHWGLTTATIAMIASKISGIPWSFTAHRGDIAGNNLLGIKMQNTSFVRFISKNSMNMALTICKKPSEGQVHIIHMGVQIPPAKEISAQLSEPPVILCPAMLIPVKGHEYLLEALAILQKRGTYCLLQLAGQGVLRSQLEEQAKSLHIIRQVTFLGHIPHNELLNLYGSGKVSVVVLPSIDMGNNESEGIPVSLMEAMGYGIPCISTTTGGIPELLGNDAGILVPPEDSFGLADAIEKLIKHDQLRNRIVRNGYMRVKEEFNIEKIVKDLISLMAASTKPHL